jgi:hypothetical protein
MMRRIRKPLKKLLYQNRFREDSEHLVDVNKFKEITLTLRRSYATKPNYRQKFKGWDISNDYMSKEDPTKIVKKLEVPINYNECTALLSTANVMDTETLNLQEFINLIFSDNPQLDIDLKKIKYKDRKIYKEENQADEYREETKAGNVRS